MNHDRNRLWHCSLLLVAAFGTPLWGTAEAPQSPLEQRVADLQERVDRQQTQIDRLIDIVTGQQARIERVACVSPGESVPVTELAPPVQPRLQADTASTQPLRFSGDIRFRADLQFRSGNASAGPLQNVRSRYRVRLNLDKIFESRLATHIQLSTGPLSNPTTNDQDFSGMNIKHPFSIAEAWLDYRPNDRISLRGGRMEEVFADGMRFLWDDDIRFNGFQQTFRVHLGAKGFNTVEFRAGQYFLGHPNETLLSATSPFTTIGYSPGGKVRDSNLFHPGLLVSGDLNHSWSHRMTADVQFYRNPQQIQLASTAAGASVLLNGAVGVTLSSPLPQGGNGTTAPGGVRYDAAGFRVARIAYRLENPNFRVGSGDVPLFIDLQVARNIAAARLRDAMIGSVNLGNVRQFGDVRVLYQYAIKDANSMIAQFTDDDLGTGATTNIASHAVRFDLGLSPSVQWQNILFVQSARRPNDPRQQFFVPLQRGANKTYRYLGQLLFTF